MDELYTYLTKLGMSPYEATEFIRLKILNGKPGAEIPGNIAPVLGGTPRADRLYDQPTFRLVNAQKEASRAYERRMFANRRVDSLGNVIASADPWDSPTTKIRYMVGPDERDAILKAAAIREQQIKAIKEKPPEFLPLPIPEQSSGKEPSNKLKSLANEASKRIVGKPTFNELMEKAEKLKKKKD